MLNRFFSHVVNNNNFFRSLNDKNIENDLAYHLKEIHTSRALIDAHQKYIRYFHSKHEFNQTFRTRMLLVMLSSTTSLLSHLWEWYAQSKLNWIVPVCQHIEREYELGILHLQTISPFSRIEPAVLEVIEEYFRNQRTLLECDNNHESMEYYSNIVGNIALTISLGVLINHFYHYLSTPSQNFNKQISYYYETLYEKIDDEITKIADKFEALSDDDKRSIQYSLNRQLSIENAIEQDATERFFLKYFCNCKQGPIVHPIEVIIEVKVGEKITNRSELYDAYLFFGYLQTQVNRQGPLRSPSGAPIAKYQFSNEVNKAHQEYWVALQKEINQLSLNKQEAISFVPQPK